MPITAEQYVEFVKQKPWNQIKEVFADRGSYDITVQKKLNINPEDWVQFTVDNIHNAQEKYEKPKDHYTGLANTLAVLNNQLGRNEENTSEFNFGMLGDSNERLIELLGEENIRTLGVHPDYILMRLIVKMPGHGVAWHIDDAGSFALKFPGLEVDENRCCEHGRAVRYWFPVTDWEDGYAMQINNTVITGDAWAPGNTYIIPWGDGHASSNFGYVPQYTVSLTGFVKE